MSIYDKIRRFKVSLMVGVTCLLCLLLPIDQTHAQRWPPFRFGLTPTYQNDQIVYDISFVVPSDVTWALRDVRIHIPLPEGTRFVEANTVDPVEVTFDGSEVRFFTFVVPKRGIQNVSFTVEPVSAGQTVFTTHAWISWEGDVPGSYISKDFNINTTYQLLDWEKPGRDRMFLSVQAMTTPGTITYFIEPRRRGSRLWDVRISMPIPPGTSLLNAEAPSVFEIGSNEQEVVFSALELDGLAAIEPLKVELSMAESRNSVITQVWATWKNVGRQVGITIPTEEAIKTADIIVTPQQGVSTIVDTQGDVPFGNYDLTSVAFQEVILPQELGAALKIRLHTAQRLGDGEPLDFEVLLDEDCQNTTGNKIRPIGAESRVRYRHNRNRVNFDVWDGEARKWQLIERLPFNAPANDKVVTLWVPYDLLQNNRNFCWLVRANYRNTRFTQFPAQEYLPDTRAVSMAYAGAANLAVRETFIPVVSTPKSSSRSSSQPREPKQRVTPQQPLIEQGAVWRYFPGWIEPDAGWTSLEFDDSHWFSGSASLGYDNEGIHFLTQGEVDQTETGEAEKSQKPQLTTDISLVKPDDYQGDIPKLILFTNPDSGAVIALPPATQDQSLYMRHTFSLTNPTALTRLRLSVTYNDGFVAYLNGQEVARRALGETGTPIVFNAVAKWPATIGKETTLNLTDHLNKLVAGENVLALQVHRASGETRLLADVLLR